MIDVRKATIGRRCDECLHAADVRIVSITPVDNVEQNDVAYTWIALCGLCAQQIIKGLMKAVEELPL